MGWKIYSRDGGGDENKLRGMSLRLIISISVVLALLSPVSAGEVEKKVDEFRGTTTYSGKETTIGRFDFRPFIVIDKNGKDSAPFFMFTVSSNSWQYLKCHTVDLLANGKAVVLAEVTHDGSVHSGGNVFESIGVFLSIDAFKQLATAEKAKGRICTEVFEFSREQIENLKILGTEAGILK